MRARAGIRFWGVGRVVVQEQAGWRVLAWPSAQLQAEGAGVFVPGPASRWAALTGGVLTTDDGRVVDPPEAVSEASWDGPDALLAVVDGRELWRLETSESGERRLLFDGEGICRAQRVGDRIGFEQQFSSGMSGVVLDPWDVCRFFLMDRSGTVEEPTPGLAGWLYQVAPSPTDPERLAFGHTELPCPYSFQVGLLVDGQPHFPFPQDVVTTGSDPAWSPDGSAVGSVAMQGIRRGIVACDPDGRSWRWVAPADGVHSSPVPLPGGEALSIWQDLATPPAIVHTTPAGRKTWAELTEPPDWWPTAPPRLVRWKSGEDELEGLLATPPGRGPFPTVVDLHGGPDGMTLQASLSSYAVPLEMWVRAGFAVFAPDYRESGILGLPAKRAATRMEPGWRTSHDDVIAGIDHVVAEGIADPGRLYVFGFSMGGLVGGHVIARDDRIRAAAFWESAGADPRAVDNALARRQFGGSPDEVPHVWDRVSLLPLAERTRIPVLIMSAGDPNTPPSRSQARWHALLPNSQHLTFPEEAHTPSPRMRTEIVRRATAWFTSQ